MGKIGPASPVAGCQPAAALSPMGDVKTFPAWRVRGTVEWTQVCSGHVHGGDYENFVVAARALWVSVWQ